MSAEDKADVDPQNEESVSKRNVKNDCFDRNMDASMVQFFVYCIQCRFQQLAQYVSVELSRISIRATFSIDYNDENWWKFTEN